MAEEMRQTAAAPAKAEVSETGLLDSLWKRAVLLAIPPPPSAAGIW